MQAQAKDMHSSANSNIHTRQENKRWEKPMKHWLKANWDAAVDSTTKQTGLGLVIRDSEGEIQVSACSKLCPNFQPVLAEATALRYAMLISRDLGLHQVIFEGDRRRVANEVNSSHETDTV